MKPQRFQLNKDGVDRPRVLDNALAFIRQLPANKSWVVEVRHYLKPRTLKQNATVFGQAYEVIMEATGLEGAKDRERLHTTMCGDYFGWRDVPIIGRVPVRTTTTNALGEPDTLSVTDMALFYAFITRTAAEYGIFIPEPDPFHDAPARSDP